MKPVVVFALTFVLATAASTGAKVALTKPLPAKHAAGDSTANKKDSTQTDTAVVASGQATTPPADSAHPAVPTPTAAAAAAPAGDSAKAVVAPAVKPPAPGALAVKQAGAPAQRPDTVLEASERRLAKVFTAMDAKQAAQVLGHMADSDVQIILGYVGPRQAASIMAALPPERVATLSKLSMQGKKE